MPETGSQLDFEDAEQHAALGKLNLAFHFHGGPKCVVQHDASCGRHPGQEYACIPVVPSVGGVPLRFNVCIHKVS